MELSLCQTMLHTLKKSLKITNMTQVLDTWVPYPFDLRLGKKKSLKIFSKTEMIEDFFFWYQRIGDFSSLRNEVKFSPCLKGDLLTFQETLLQIYHHLWSIDDQSHCLYWPLTKLNFGSNVRFHSIIAHHYCIFLHFPIWQTLFISSSSLLPMWLLNVCSS